MDPRNYTLEIEQQIEIQSTPDAAFEGLLRQLTERNHVPLLLERWPDGRWFRDLGEGAGHLWGFVQVIKPPTLLEICGPLFMSYAAVSNVQYRLSEENGVTRLQFAHRTMGQIPADHRENMGKGWTAILTRIQQAAERRGSAVHKGR